ncbi:MAG TPA: hypothetical protein ENJ32_09310 [Crenotrichaceae bacterium]|nr:hypothetical protein [Crenotrichaceae bacterium]
MKQLMVLMVVVSILGGCVTRSQAGHQRIPSNDYSRPAVDVFIVNDRGQRLSAYPVRSSSRLEKEYIEAQEGQPYSINIINRSNERIGVVIAVDGRNIISGKYSKLRSKERLYILDPHQRQSFSGWRSGKNRIKRFYFTDAGQSYAASFNDYSALGVIAVAAFREQRYPEYRSRKKPKRYTYQSKPHSSRESAATGWGRSEYSPSQKVEFHAQKKPFNKHLIKYEWREALCERHILDCYRSPHSRQNRMWDDDDRYAPPPGRRFRRYNEW